MIDMPRYTRPSYTPLPDDIAAAFDALDTGFSRAIINYFSQNPGARPPDAARAFDKTRAFVYRAVNTLESVGVLRRIKGSGRRIGSGQSFAYEVDQDRLNSILDTLHAYLLATSAYRTTPIPPETSTSNSETE